MYSVDIATETSATSGDADSGIRSDSRVGGDLITGGFKAESSLLMIAGFVGAFLLINSLFKK